MLNLKKNPELIIYGLLLFFAMCLMLGVCNRCNKNKPAPSTDSNALYQSLQDSLAFYRGYTERLNQELTASWDSNKVLKQERQVIQVKKVANKIKYNEVKTRIDTINDNAELRRQFTNY